jgi:hypothetical protein
VTVRRQKAGRSASSSFRVVLALRQWSWRRCGARLQPDVRPPSWTALEWSTSHQREGMRHPGKTHVQSRARARLGCTAEGWALVHVVKIVWDRIVSTQDRSGRIGNPDRCSTPIGRSSAVNPKWTFSAIPTTYRTTRTEHENASKNLQNRQSCGSELTRCGRQRVLLSSKSHLEERSARFP